MNREFVEGERERGREEGAYSRSPQDRVTPGQPIQKKSLQMKTIGRGVRLPRARIRLRGVSGKKIRKKIVAATYARINMCVPRENKDNKIKDNNDINITFIRRDKKHMFENYIVCRYYRSM